MIRTEPKHWHPELRRLVEFLQESPLRKQPGEPDPIVRLPLPPLTGGVLAFEGAHDDPEREKVDRRLHGWTSDVAEPIGEGKCRGAKREQVEIHFFDRMWMSLRKKPADPHDPNAPVIWECRVQHKARETYADGVNLWQVRWLGLMSWLLLGRWLPPSKLHAAGWNVSRLDVNSDFEHLRLAATDAGRFMTTATPRAIGKMLDMHMSRRDPYWGETLELGRETSDVCCKAYQKSTQLRDAKHVEPQDSMYAPLWKAHGWDGRADITRIEWRLTKKGLIYTDPSTGDIVLDLRDPAALLKTENLRKLWEYLCTRRRLTLPTATRKTRCAVDPAWVEVIRLGAERPRPAPMRQVPRWVRALRQDERLAKWMMQSALGAIGYMAGHGCAPTDWADVGRVMQAMGARLVREGQASVVPDVFRPLPTMRRVSESPKGKSSAAREHLNRASDYAKLASVFFHREASALRGQLLEQVDSYLAPVDWGRVARTVPPEDRRERDWPRVLELLQLLLDELMPDPGRAPLYLDWLGLMPEDLKPKDNTS